jgi:hypothetical protein
MNGFRRLFLAGLTGASLVAGGCTGPAAPARSPTTSRAPSTSVTATSSPDPGSTVTVEAILGHLETLQEIADEHGGTRAAGSDGYEASVDYVAATLRDLGYVVETPPTEVPVFAQRAPSVLERLDPAPQTWADERDLRAMLFSASGDVEGALAASPAGARAPTSPDPGEHRTRRARSLLPPRPGENARRRRRGLRRPHHGAPGRSPTLLFPKASRCRRSR